MTGASSATFLMSRDYVKAARALVLAVGIFGAYLLCFVALIPQKAVTVGDSYCQDSWCIRLDKVTASPRPHDIEYNVDVHIFSDLNRGQTSAKGYSVYLADESGRRFPLVADPAVIPIDVTLNPHESVETKLTFVAAANSRHLYLMGDGQNTPAPWLQFLARLYSGGDPKPVLIRVL